MNRRVATGLLLGALVMIAALGWWLRRPVAAKPWAEQIEVIDLGAEDWAELSIEGNALDLLGVDRFRFVELGSDGWAPVWLYAGYYAGQRENAQIHAPEHCYPGSGYEIVRSRPLGGEGRNLRELLVARRGQKRLVWFGFQTRVGQPLSPFGLKRDQMVSALLGRGRDALLVRVSTPILELEGEEAARTRLRGAWDQSGSILLNWYEREGR